MSIVSVRRVEHYDVDAIVRALPDGPFDQIERGHRVVLKPNWVLESHVGRPEDWDYVITHPTVITAVLGKVLQRLGGSGRISIVDGPTTEASFRKLMTRYPVDHWRALAAVAHVPLEIIDLRDWEWSTRNQVVVARRRLAGDPRGKTEVNLAGAASEFHGHVRSRRGYYGADYDRAETNRVHDGQRNLYSVSRTVLEADVFINLPKLKTHRKTGITCCLKNLVGINTYKNYLPHYSEGGPSEGGDQYPEDNVNARVEGPLMAFVRQRLMTRPLLARVLAPLDPVARRVFGQTRAVIRSGNWHGNDTIWRMVLDLNKVLLYGEPDGTMRADAFVNARRYIGVVDAVLAGEGHGPLAPDPVRMNVIACGSDPVAIDAVCASLMGFDPLRIPSIARAWEISQFRVCPPGTADVHVDLDGVVMSIEELPPEVITPCTPQFGWVGYIEKVTHGAARAS